MWGPRRGFALGPRQGLCPWTPLGAPPPNPWPAFEKAGENQLVNFFGFPAECAGPPLIGSGGLVWFEESRGWKGWWMDRLDGGKSQRSGGRRRLAAVGWPCGPPHGLPNKRAGPWAFGPGPCSFRTLRVPPPPPRRVFRQRQKGSANSSPAPPHPGKGGSGREPVSQGHGTRNAVRKGQDAGSLRGQSPGPRVTGPGGTARPAAGYGLRPPAPAVARFSPPAKGRRPRRAAARVGPPSAQGSYRTAHPPLPRGVRSAILINNQYYEMRFTI